MSDFDLPPQSYAEQIRRREFSSGRRGYDPDQVRDYLYSVAERIESMEQELRQTQAAMQRLQELASSQEAPQQVEPEQDPYEMLGKRIAGLLSTADKEANRLVKDAHGEAERITDEARTEATEVRVDADARAEAARTESRRMLEEAREEADRVIAGVAARRRVLAEQLETMQSRLLEAAESLDVIMDRGEGEDEDEEPEPMDEADATDVSDPSTATEAIAPDFGDIDFNLDASDEPPQDA